jgi:hypothetical protein
MNQRFQCVALESQQPDQKIGHPSCDFEPDFLWSLVALAKFMLLSLMKAAHAVVSRLRTGNPGRGRKEKSFIMFAGRK